jgi:hypothetical protein
MKISRLQELEARMDEQLHQFGYFTQDPETDPNGIGLKTRKVVAGLAAGTAAGYGVAAYKNRAAIQAGAKDVARKGLKKTARAAGVASDALHKTALKSTGVPMRAAGAGSTVLQKAATGLRKVAKDFDRGEIDAIIGLAERIAELEKADNIIQFDDGGDDREKRWARFGKATAVGSAVTGASSVYQNRKAIKAAATKGAAAVSGKAAEVAAKAGKKLRFVKGSLLARAASAAS